MLVKSGLIGSEQGHCRDKALDSRATLALRASLTAS
jgi:hypothetical protein